MHVFVFFTFRVLPKVKTAWDFCHNILSREGSGTERVNETSHGGRDGAHHAAIYLGRVVGPTWRLENRLPTSFASKSPSWPKTDYKKAPRSVPERRRRRREKHRKRDLKLQRLEGEPLPEPPGASPSSPTTSPPSPWWGVVQLCTMGL